ncbi:MAG: hypothetical protein ACC652_00200 [Acidimicrobiales bacterium]
MSRSTNGEHGSRARWQRAAAGLLAIAMFAAACGDSDERTTQEKYCDAGDSLRTSVDALLNIDVIAVGTSGVEDAFNQIVDDVGNLRDAASDAAKDDVDALGQAIQGGKSVLKDLGDEITTDNVTALLSSVGAIDSSASAVYVTLTDCP